MNNNELKELLQKDAADKVVQCKSVALPWATGLGKTFAALMAVEQTRAKSVLVFVAETAHKKNWRKEIRKFKKLYPNTLEAVEFVFECYNSIHKYECTDWEFLIFDEAHHLHTEKRMGHAKYIASEFTMYLSATMSPFMLNDFRRLYNKRIEILPYSMNKSIEQNLLPEPKIILVPLELREANGKTVIEESWGKKENRIEIKCKFEQRFAFLKNKNTYKNVLLKMEASPMQAYNHYTTQIEYYKSLFLKNRLPIFETKWKQYALKRKKLMGNSKTAHAVELINLLRKDNRKFICFCNSIEQAELLGKENCIHSKKPNNSDIIEEFNEGKRKELYVVEMLKEGQNLNGIESGIVIQLDNEIRNFIQKMGRVMRAESPMFFIIYYKNTRDEELLKSTLTNFNDKYITTIDEFYRQNQSRQWTIQKECSNCSE